MIDRTSDDKFVEEAARVLREAEHDVDVDVLERLAAMRRTAVALADHPAPTAIGRWAPTSAVAATILAVGIAFTNFQGTSPGMFDNELEQLAAQDMELLEELEFLAWMELQAEQSNAG